MSRQLGAWLHQLATLQHYTLQCAVFKPGQCNVYLLKGHTAKLPLYVGHIKMTSFTGLFYDTESRGKVM